ncbi:glycyl-tRNA synthetase subunit alpha [Hydrogenivirga sp. 128-5-R1-1]|nr:glycyl-tRNA synthetase subunit alpha [Hydrogenivirga sp. 128-5-R1-1]
MKSKELLKFIAETFRNIGVGFIISSEVLFISEHIEARNVIMLFLLGVYTIAFSIYLFMFYERGGKK